MDAKRRNFLVAEMTTVVIRKLYGVNADSEREALDIVARGDVEAMDEYQAEQIGQPRRRIVAINGVYRGEERDDADAA